MSIHEYLAPLIRERGIGVVARSTGIDHSQLLAWVNQTTRKDTGRTRGLSESNLEAIATTVGGSWLMVDNQMGVIE